MSGSTWDADRLLLRRIGDLLADCYDNSLTKLVAGITREELFAPLSMLGENGCSMQVSMRAVQKSYGRHCWRSICRYAQLCDREEELEGLYPFHLSETPTGTWNEEANRDAALVRHVEYLQRTKPGCNGKIEVLVATLEKDDLLGSFVEEINGVRFEVKFSGAAGKFRTCPWLVLQRYFLLKGLTKRFNRLRPYHLNSASKGTYDDPAVVDEVLEKKIDQLLRKMKDCRGNLAHFCAIVTVEDLLSPLVERIAGYRFKVSMHKAFEHCGHCVFRMVWRVIVRKGLKQRFARLRPWHLLKASEGTYNDNTVFDVKTMTLVERAPGDKRLTTVDELLVKVTERLISRKPCQGKLERFIPLVREEDFGRPFVEVIAGHRFKISTGAALAHYGRSPFRLIRRYIEIKGLKYRFRALKPIHFATSSEGAYQDEGTYDYLLGLKVRQAMKKRGCRGSLARLLKVVKKRDLVSGVMVTLNGHQFEVSMGRTAKHFDDSPYRMLSRYIELQGLTEEFKGLRPYHLARAKGGTFQNQQMVEEVLCKKVGQLLLKHGLSGETLSELIPLITRNDFLTPVIEEIAGVEIRVPMHKVVAYYQGSSHRMLKRYAELHELSFPFSNRVFYGSPTTRALRVSEELLRAA